VKVRVARNSEELKAVAALRVSIFQQFVNPKQRKENMQNLKNKNILPKHIRAANNRARIIAGRASATMTKPTTQEQISESMQKAHQQVILNEAAQKLKYTKTGAPQSLKSLKAGEQVGVDLKEQWLRKQSGIEAARIYNLGERCLCLLAVYHPKDEEEKSLLTGSRRDLFGSEQANHNDRDMGKSNNSSIGERLLSPFFRWQAPPVPKVPPFPLDQQEGQGGPKHESYEDEDGGLIIGTLNIHFGQPFRPKPKQASKSTQEQVQASKRGVLRAVENAQRSSTAPTKARVFNSLWRKKQEQVQVQQRKQLELDFFQLPSEEKALQKVSRDCKQAYIFNLCVSPAFRRQGIATMLLERAQDIAAKKGVKECFLHVDFGNDAAEKLYEDNGYIMEEDEEGKWTYIAGSRKRQLMSKKL